MFKIWLVNTSAQNDRVEIEVDPEWKASDLKPKLTQIAGSQNFRLFYEAFEITYDGRSLKALGISSGAQILLVSEVVSPQASPEKSVSRDDTIPPMMTTIDPSNIQNGIDGAPTSDNLFEDQEKPYHRVMRRVVFSKYCTAFTLILALTSFAFFIVGFFCSGCLLAENKNVIKGSPHWLQILDLLVTLLFAGEIFFSYYGFPSFLVFLF